MQKIVRFTQKYDVRQYILWLCIALCAISLAILPLSYSYLSIKIPINCLYTACGLFLLCFYKDVKHIRQIWFVLVCMAVIVVMAYISLLYAAHIDWTKTAIRQYLLEPTLFMICSFLLVQRLSQRQLLGLFVALCVALFYHPLATIYDFYANWNGMFGYRAMLPSYHVPATVYVFYLLFALSIAYVGFLKTKGLLKLIFGVFVLLGIAAFVLNGGRFGILACLTIISAPLVCFAYTYKKLSLALLCLGLIGASVALYYGSQKWDSRYNLHNALNTFSEVWHTPPAAMGQYLGGGCESWAKCSKHSLNQPSSIVWEYSSVDRISKLKATLLAIADNPLRPNGYHFQQFPFNIQHIFPLDSINHPFSLTPYKDTFIMSNAHNHNYPLSVFFELGLIGFIGFCAFSLFFPVSMWRVKIALKAKNTDIGEIIIGSIGIAVIGLIVANMFDCIPVRDGQLMLFVMYGIFLGVRYGALRQK